MKNNTKILATLGPAIENKDRLRELLIAGANVLRLNFSHGSHDDHLTRLQWIRELEQELGRPLGVLMDLQGPKLRVGTFSESAVLLMEGQTFRFDLDKTPGDKERVNLPHPEIIAAAKPGMNMLVDDGLIRLEVTEKGDDFIGTRVVVPGVISDRKGVNVPDVVLDLSPLTDKDKIDLEFGLTHGADWVALSFVQRPEDIEQAKGLIKGRAKIMAKIEKPSAVEKLDAIIEAADGVMVARGDLGVELPVERLPAIQKQLISRCRKAGKPVVVATQMLESMRSAPTPTRAEVTDVANAVYDGTDAVMLSAETASGQHPVQAVAMMTKIIASVEHDPGYRAILDANKPEAESTFADAISCALRRITHILPVKVIVNYTKSGMSSQRVSRERPEAPVLSLTSNRFAARALTLSWGAVPVFDEALVTQSELETHAIDAALREGLVKEGDLLAITAGSNKYPAGWTNTLRLEQVTQQK
jgi:pyruvate kinase